MCSRIIICVFGLKESLFTIWEKFRRERNHIWHRGYCHASIYIKRTTGFRPAPLLTAWSLTSLRPLSAKGHVRKCIFTGINSCSSTGTPGCFRYLSFPHRCPVLLQLCKFSRCFPGEEEKNNCMGSLLPYIYILKIGGARKNATAFIFMVNKPRWICGKRCWDRHQANHHVTGNIIKFCNFLLWK